MLTRDFECRGFQIIGTGPDGLPMATDACAQFMYKGFQISFSTIGRSQGGCMNPVEIFTGDNFNTRIKEVKGTMMEIGGFHNVEDALKYVDDFLVGGQ